MLHQPLDSSLTCTRAAGRAQYRKTIGHRRAGVVGNAFPVCGTIGFSIFCTAALCGMVSAAMTRPDSDSSLWCHSRARITSLSYFQTRKRVLGTLRLPADATMSAIRASSENSDRVLRPLTQSRLPTHLDPGHHVKVERPSRRESAVCPVLRAQGYRLRPSKMCRSRSPGRSAAGGKPHLTNANTL
jgi:hypothetical protein